MKWFLHANRTACGIICVLVIAYGGDFIGAGSAMIDSSSTGDGGLPLFFGSISSIAGILLVTFTGSTLIAVVVSIIAKGAVKTVANLFWMSCYALMISIAVMIERSSQRKATAEAAVVAAADSGDVYSQMKLGRKLYRQWQYGSGAESTERCLEAMDLFTRAAVQGDATGQCWMATSYKNCYPAEPEYKKQMVYVWYKVAAHSMDYSSDCNPDAYFYYFERDHASSIDEEEIAEAEHLAAGVIDVLEGSDSSSAKQEVVNQLLGPLLKHMEENRFDGE
jgi:hypothetical protein